MNGEGEKEKLKTEEVKKRWNYILLVAAFIVAAFNTYIGKNFTLTYLIFMSIGLAFLIDYTLALGYEMSRNLYEIAEILKEVKNKLENKPYEDPPAKKKQVTGAGAVAGALVGGAFGAALGGSFGMLIGGVLGAIIGDLMERS